jgi:hypothetical protein
MIVYRRPVASWKPQSVGDSGLDRVEPEKPVSKSPSDTDVFAKVLVRGSRGPLERLSHHGLDRIAPAYELGEGVGVVPLTRVFRVAL